MLNNLLERPEAQDTGSIILTGFEPDTVLNAIEATIAHYQSPVTS